MQRILLILIVAYICLACNTNQEPVFVYGVEDVRVTQEGAEKANPKTDLEFLSLVYADLFGQSISEQELNALVLAYNATGDKNLIADVIVRNMLNSPDASVPDDQSMRANLDQFIDDTYLKFYVREPSEYERWELKQVLEQDQEITAEMIYYAFLTSDEYRFY